jgi:hypothetical protein
MACCDSSNSLFKGREKFISFFKEKLVAQDAASILADLSFCGLKIKYDQVLKGSTYLPPGAVNMEIPYGGLGTDITFFAMKATYDATNKRLDDNYIQYYFAGQPDVVRNIAGITIFSGTDSSRIPTIFLNNPNNVYGVRIEFMAATGVIVFRETTVTQISNETFNIDNLNFNSITTNTMTYDFIVKDNSGNILAIINRDTISNIETNGRIIIIDDLAQGSIYLTFVDEFNANQAFSLINWALADAAQNLILPNMSADITPPVITFNPSLNLNWVLADYPDGNGGYLITKQMLIDGFISNVTDNRDGQIILTDDNITITLINSNLSLQAITAEGKYNILIAVEDIAQNRTVDSILLNVKDTNPAKIILTDLGSQIVLENSTSGTSGWVQQRIYLEDFGADHIIEKQDFINLFVGQVVDLKDGQYPLNTNNITVTITNAGGPTIYPDVYIPGRYDVYFTVIDQDLNVTSDLWMNSLTELPLDYVPVTISQNQPPVIYFNDVEPQYLLAYENGIIVKDYLKSLCIAKVTDDRDITINVTVLDLTIYKTYNYLPDYGTAGTSGIISGNGTSGINTFNYEPIFPLEKLYIIEPGIYELYVTVTDSDNASTTDSQNIEVRS